MVRVHGVGLFLHRIRYVRKSMTGILVSTGSTGISSQRILLREFLTSLNRFAVSNNIFLEVDSLNGSTNEVYCLKV